MPIIPESSYKRSFFLRNLHAQSVLPNVMRKVHDVQYIRKRITMIDNDFIDLDWSYVGSTRVAIMLHGLEGHSMHLYVKGMVRDCNQAGWDTVSVNMRGCSGEPNLLPRFYHHGSSDDLAHVIDHVSMLHYQSIARYV